MPDETQRVAAHYARADLGAAILAALRAAGKDPDELTPDDLAPLDQFHVRGLEATEQLAELAALEAGTRVLDVGCGIGGPARHLAAKHGCRVTGLDLTEEYCRVANMLAARTGLGERVEFRHGDALAMPFEDASFDVVWTQHASMNIADKDGLYAEMRRVLGLGGRLALYDIVAGPGGPPHFPVSWARAPEISFLVSPEALRAGLEASGFEVAVWRDVTAAGIDWLGRMRAKAPEGGQPPPLGLHVVVGPDWAEMFANVGRNLEQGRIALIQALVRKG